MTGSLVQSAALSQTMAGSLVQPADFPALYMSQTQLSQSTKTCAIAGVIMSKLQVHSRPLRISASRIPHTFFLGAGSILPGQTVRPICKRAKSVAVKAMFEQYTEKAIKVIMLAQEEARRLGHNFVGTQQILLGLIGEEKGIAAKVLKSMGINIKNARVEVEKIIGRGSRFVNVEIPFAPLANRALGHSLEEARQLGPEHFLLGLLCERESVALLVLKALGADSNNIRTLVIRMVAKSMQIVDAGVGGESSGQKKKMPTLEEHGTNLTKLAEEGKQDRAVGWQEQRKRFTRFLGRNAYAEGLVEHIANEDVPETIEGKKVSSLSDDRYYTFCEDNRPSNLF